MAASANQAFNLSTSSAVEFGTILVFGGGCVRTLFFWRIKN
jgi:hypothetical protein